MKTEEGMDDLRRGDEEEKPESKFMISALQERAISS